MRLDATQQVRAVQGRHEQSGRSTSPSPRQERHAGFRRPALPRLDTGINLATFLLLLADVRAAGPLTRQALPLQRGDASTTGVSQARAALIPAAGAAEHRPLVPSPPPDSGTRLSLIANGVLGTCVASPRSCAAAITGGAALAGFVMVKAAMEKRVTGQAEQRPASQPARQDPLLDAIDGVAGTPGASAADHSDLQRDLLDIARRCGGDRQCRAEAINALLRKLPPATLAMIQRMVDATAMGTAGFPPGAEALPLVTDAFEALVSLLADTYTPEVAHYQDDLESIIAVNGDRIGSESAANNRRLATIRALFERDGHRVREWAFQAVDRLHPDVLHTGSNLLVSLSARGAESPARRRLLLVAHGDMAGLASGSEGAYDNASGVAALLHVLRQLDHHTFDADTQVQVLVTSHEEQHFLGSSAFVERCSRQQDCPTLVINVDLVGRGGHNYVLSGSDALAGHYFVGKAPLNLANPSPGTAEDSVSQRLQSCFSAEGFVRQPEGEPLLLTSDNLSFQNASIPSFGLAQMSAIDARALRDIQHARIAYEQAINAVDWRRYGAHHRGTLTLAQEELERYQQAERTADQAWDRYRELRQRWKHSSGELIHKAGDRLYRVNPRMAVNFATALVAFVRDWTTAAANESPASPAHP